MPGPTNADFEVSLRFRDKATGKFIKATDTMKKAVQKQAADTQRNHQKIKTSTKQMTAQYARGMKSMRLSTSGAREAIGRLRNQLLLITFAYQLFARVIKPTIELAIKQEFAERKLEAAFAGSNRATRSQVQALKDLANQLQSTTMFSNEAIINAQAMLATFQLTAEQVEELSERMLDMATAVTNVSGKEADLQAIAIALGKGVTGNIGILSRYGIVLSETAKKSGDFNLIMKELDKNFKGMAESMRTTFMGQMKMSGNVVGDFQKELGFVITKSTVLIATMDIFRKSLIKTTKELKDVREKTDQFANGWLRAAVYIISITGVLRALWRSLTEGFRVITLFIGKMLELIISIPFLAEKFKMANATIKEFNELLKEDLVEGGKAVGDVWMEMVEQVEVLMETMKDFADMDTEILEKLKANTDELNKELNKRVEAWETTKTDISNSLHTFFYDVMIGEMKTVQDYWTLFTQAILKSWTKMLADMMVKAMFWKGVMAALNMFSGGTTGAATSVGKGLVTAIAHQGGFNERGRIKRYHTGGEVNARLLDGEGVVNRRGMSSLGREGLAAINRGDSSPGRGTINQYYINAIDVKTFRDFLVENEDIFVASVQGNIESNSSLRKLFKSGI